MALHVPVNTIAATFHQGNDKFGHTKGIQCSCISLFCVSFSAFENIARWNCHDLEYILEQGDVLYKSTGRTEFLSCPDLPREITIETNLVQLDLPQNGNYFGFLHHGSNCLSELIHNLTQDHDHTGILFFCEGYTFSIVTSTSSRYVYIIDSHSRNKNGEPCSDGTAVILKFNDLVAVSSFIKHIYHSVPARELVQYEVQYVKITNEISDSTRQQVLASHRSDRQKNICRTLVSQRVRKRRLSVMLKQDTNV